MLQEDRDAPAHLLFDVSLLTMLVVLTWLVPCLTMAVTYPLAIQAGRVHSNDFYISSSIDTGIAQKIGSFGLTVGAEALFICMAVRYCLVSRHPRNTKRALYLNRVGLLLAMLVNVGTVGVGVFNVSYSPVIHQLFAYTAFISVTVYMAIQLIVDVNLRLDKDDGWEPVLFRLRRTIFTSASVCCLGMAATNFHPNQAIPAAFECALMIQVFFYFALWHGLVLRYSHLIISSPTLMTHFTNFAAATGRDSPHVDDAHTHLLYANQTVKIPIQLPNKALSRS
mmetsp:Transcript_38310/g.61499  ORF Transcript_38310/g.61499 Transcript_38310/m.61499 type:complete len:281 (-) Transcript_38310:257-1099(-)